MTMTAQEADRIKQAIPSDGVLPVFHQRWSARAFADREVTQEELRRVFEAARWAPSSGNEQPWRYVVGTRGTETHKKILESLMPGNHVWAKKAPVLMIGVAKTRFSKDDRPNHYAVFDLGASTAYLVLQAAALGLTTHQMAGFDREKARTLLAIPDGYDFGAAIALGYQGEPETLANEELIQRETAPRERRPLREIVFAEWGKGLF